MRYRCEILNHGIDGYEVWLHGRNQGRSGVKMTIFLNDLCRNVKKWTFLLRRNLKIGLFLIA